MKKNAQILLIPGVLAVLAAGLWLRWQFIHTVQLYPDEFVTLLAVKMIGQKGVPVMPSGLFYEHGLLFSYVGSVAALFGPARETVRLSSLLFGGLTVLLTFWVGQRWFSAPAALLAVAGLAVSPAAIQWSARARMYALFQFLALLTLWLAFEGAVKSRRGLRWTALLLFFLATLTHFGAVALAPPLAVAALVIFWRSGTLRRHLRDRRFWLEVAALGIILITAFLVKRAGQPRGIEPLEGGAAAAVGGIAQVLQIYSDLSLDVAGGWESISPFYLAAPALIFAPFALLVTLLSAVWLLKKLPARLPLRLPAVFLSVILGLTTLEMIFLVSPHRRDDKYLFMLLPVLFLLGAEGMALVAHRLTSTISRDWEKSLWLTVGALAGAALIFAAGWPAAQTLLADTGDDYDSAFAFVQQQWQPGDKILAGSPPAAEFYLGHNDFYSVQRRGGYDYRILTVDGQAVDRWLASPAVRTEAALHQTLADNRVWLVLERWGLQREYYDLPFQQQLLAQTDLVGESQGIFVLRSKDNPRPIAPEPAATVEATFGNVLRLQGYTVEPEQGTPGGTVRLTLYWQALKPVPHDYTVFVHLRDPANGGNVAQADHQPLERLFPTSVWPVGETIRETSQLALPAELLPGTYQLWTGVYLLETGERLPVQNDSSGENAVLLGELTISNETPEKRCF